MDKQRTIAEIYNAEKEENPPTSLVEWGNRLLDKKYDEINTADAERMLRQDYFPDMARQRAVELFLSDPFDGESYDGELLEHIIRFNVVKEFTAVGDHLLNQYSNIIHLANEREWDLEEDRTEFFDNFKKLHDRLVEARRSGEY